MKKQKMSLEKMKSVLSNVLSREEMKEVMAGSGPGGQSCSGLPCTPPGMGLGNCAWDNAFSGCRCSGNNAYHCAGA